MGSQGHPLPIQRLDAPSLFYNASQVTPHRQIEQDGKLLCWQSDRFEIRQLLVAIDRLRLVNTC